MKTTELKRLIDDGRETYDQVQAWCSATAAMSDEELAASPDLMDELFQGYQLHPEYRRDEARRTQDRLTAQGREAYALEYAGINKAIFRN